MYVAALPGETEQVQHEIKNISKFNYYRHITAAITVHWQYLQCYAAASLWDAV